MDEKASKFWYEHILPYFSMMEKNDGLQAGILCAIVSSDSHGFQAAPGATGATNCYGMQFSFGANGVVEKFHGFQLAGEGNCAGEARGLMVATFGNYVVEADGVLLLGGICIIRSNPWYAKALPFCNYGGRKAKRKAKIAQKQSLEVIAGNGSSLTFPRF